MKEHEQKEYERLRAEGRWPEANEFREAERKRLRVGGRNRQQACDESWSAMLSKFPPQGQGKPQSSEVEAERIDEVDDGVSIEHSEDERRELLELAQDPGAWDDTWHDALGWACAYRNLEVPPSRALSILGWLLRKLAREDFHRFSVLVVTDYTLRHGQQLQFRPLTSEHEQRLQQQMFQDLECDENLAYLDELDEEDGQLGKSPTIMEALDNAETDEEAVRVMQQLVERLAAERGWNHNNEASKASKS